MSSPSAPHTAAPASRGSDAASTARIRAAVNDAADALLQRHPWLRHQDTIGLCIQMGAIAGMVACAWLYLGGWLPAWATIVAVAICASLTHEMEHDLIHQLYFKKQPWMQDLLMLLGWLARPTTINPWTRRALHFHHHKFSGEANDLEERAITNGEPWGLRRLLMTADMHLSYLLRRKVFRSIIVAFMKTATKSAPRPGWGGRFEKLMRYTPLNLAAWILWHAFLAYHLADATAAALGHPIAWSAGIQGTMAWLNPLTVCLLAPNVLRTFCLHFISSNMHYYGNVQRGNAMHQCQVFQHPLLWPLQLFCFNFGATHAIHHFVVGQTFYVRQLIAAQAHRVMRAEGVPFNDFGTFARANRRAASMDAAEPATA